MSRYSEREDIEATLNGEYDTDRGGRQPLERQIRRAHWSRLVPMADWTDEDWQPLTAPDCLLISELASRIAAKATTYAIVRTKQSGSFTKRGRI